MTRYSGRRPLGELLSMESIDFQSPVLFQELTLLCEEFKKIKRKEARDSEIATRITKAIKHHTNVSIRLDVGDINPCVYPPALDRNNILVNEAYRSWMTNAESRAMIRDSGGVIRGSVNLNKAWVSGAFAEVVCLMHMPIDMMVGTKYTAEECAAVMLHELGHVFTYFEYITRSTTTNQVMVQMVRQLDNTMGPSEREAILVSVKKALALNDLDVKQLAKTNDKKVIELVVVQHAVKEVKSQLGGANLYDLNTWEMLSDQFAARMGAQRPLITALDKLMRSLGDKAFRSTPMFVALEALKFFTVCAGYYLGGVWGKIVFDIALAAMAMDSDGDGSYDKPEARLKRIRNQIVEQLKDKTLDKDTQDRLKADIAVVDDVVSKVNDRRQLVGVLYDFILPSARRARTQEVLQKELEELAFNQLFVKSAELSAQV